VSEGTHRCDLRHITDFESTVVLPAKGSVRVSRFPCSGFLTEGNMCELET
jgi:hypothetical protein